MWQLLNVHVVVLRHSHDIMRIVTPLFCCFDCPAAATQPPPVPSCLPVRNWPARSQATMCVRRVNDFIFLALAYKVGGNQSSPLLSNLATHD